MKKIRLDTLLVEKDLYPDCDAALRGVLAREVKVDDVYAQSAALMVDPLAKLCVKKKHPYVSRGGLKLAYALEAFDQEVKGLRCLDIGSSTGGFTDCLLQKGALEVTCLDVNYGQLAWKIRQDERVRVFERTNIRYADPLEIGAPFDLLVADLSFISLSRLVPVFVSYMEAGSVCIGLIKPQFESQVGEAAGGVVRDEAVRQRVVAEVGQAFEEEGLVVTGVVESPIKGPAGNVEYLVRAVVIS